MGTVHKFKRPPKNRQQFRGSPVPGGGRPPRKRLYLRPWQVSVLAWLGLIGLATILALVFQ